MKVDISHVGVPENDLAKKISGAESALNTLQSGQLPMTGWVRIPTRSDQEEIKRIARTAKEIQKKCELLVVVGIGGSSLGAKAVLEALGSDGKKKTDVRFAGETLDPADLRTTVDEIQAKESCLCVISKSGTTMETQIAFGILKEAMREKYRNGAADRIYTITDGKQGILREETIRHKYVSFDVPEDVGGRYSVLSTVGLLPLAVGGVDITELLGGAEVFARDGERCFDAAKYAAARICLGEHGKLVEALESFDPAMETFGRWAQQLLAESEGKEGKGIFPTILTFTRDLHSVGQFLQEGTPVVFETMVLFDKIGDDMILPKAVGDNLAGLTMKQVGDCVVKGVIAAHLNAGIPLITITMPKKTAFAMGQLIYFFELAAGISALLLEVDPFNQPGVERYKQEAWAEIKKLLLEQTPDLARTP
jgi:glucose-6-phosphate isomerase